MTITGYIGYTIAFLTASNALGLNMANLAIVAGALSVGIGLAYKQSSIILSLALFCSFERPFKVGDWVTVGGNEGIVKRLKCAQQNLKHFQKSL